MHDHSRHVTGRVGTHGEVDVAAVIDPTVRVMANQLMPSSAAANRHLPHAPERRLRDALAKRR